MTKYIVQFDISPEEKRPRLTPESVLEVISSLEGTILEKTQTYGHAVRINESFPPKPQADALLRVDIPQSSDVVKTAFMQAEYDGAERIGDIDVYINTSEIWPEGGAPFNVKDLSFWQGWDFVEQFLQKFKIPQPFSRTGYENFLSNTQKELRGWSRIFLLSYMQNMLSPNLTLLKPLFFC